MLAIVWRTLCDPVWPALPMGSLWLLSYHNCGVHPWHLPLRNSHHHANRRVSTRANVNIRTGDSSGNSSKWQRVRRYLRISSGACRRAAPIGSGAFMFAGSDFMVIICYVANVLRMPVPQSCWCCAHLRSFNMSGCIVMLT